MNKFLKFYCFLNKLIIFLIFFFKLNFEFNLIFILLKLKIIFFFYKNLFFFLIIFLKNNLKKINLIKFKKYFFIKL